MHTMPRPMLWIVLAGAALTALAAGPDADAEVIRFRNGVILHGEVTQSDQKWFKFRRYDTGGVVTLAWDQILEQDRQKLRGELRLDVKEDTLEGPTISGVRLHLKSGETVEGLRDTEKSNENEVWIKTTAGSFPYKKAMIESEEKLDIDILSVYSRPEAYDYELQRRSDAGLSNDSAAGHYEIGDYCMKIAHYAKAKEHFLQVQTVDPGYQAQAVANVLQRLEHLIAQAEANALFADLERAKANKKFKDAREIWKKLTADHADSDVVKEHEETIEDLIDVEEAKYLEKQVKPKFFTALIKAIKKRAREKYTETDGQKEEFTLKAAKSWARKEATKLAAAEVAEILQITADQVKEVFAQRKSYDFRRGSYSDGTFIVEKANIQLPKQNQRNLQNLLRNRRRGGNQPSSNQAKQQLQTPDDWWKKANSGKRAQWMIAYMAENGGEMEIVRIDTRPCVTCGGKGYLTYLTPGAETGGTKYKICHRCHGVAHDRTVVYR